MSAITRLLRWLGLSEPEPVTCDVCGETPCGDDFYCTNKDVIDEMRRHASHPRHCWRCGARQ